MEEIQRALQNIERQYDVRILFACEAGSRALGYATDESDCDVRFIYVHHKEWYLSLFAQRDVIEFSIDQVEFHGWDLQKTLKLLTKSNPTLMEWLQSPRIYLEALQFKDVRILAKEAFSTKPMLFHYIKMGRGNLSSYRKTKKQKFLLYALKSLLLSDLVYRKGTLQVINLWALLDDSHIQREIKESCKALLSRKRLVITEPVVTFLEEQFDGLEEKAFRVENKQAVAKSKFDSVFLQIVNRS